MKEYVEMLNNNQLGRQIDAFMDEFPDLADCNIALIGVGPFSMAIRRSLYEMEGFNQLKIADLGNVASISTSALKPVLDELYNAEIIPILLGGDDTLVHTLVTTQHPERKKSHPLFVDDKIAFGKVLQRSYINTIAEDENHQSSSFTVLGYQKHISSPEPFNKDHDHVLNVLRLAQVKSDPRAMEPYIRDCTSLSFSLNAVKKAEAPNKAGFNPSGLESENACQICRYAGLNEQLSGFIIHGVNTETKECGQTATLIAQMIWYFTDGVQNRMSEFPITPQHLTEYVVTSSCWSGSLHFFKSMISGRWWMAHPQHDGDMNNLIPCTYDEYLSACRDEIPDRLISLIS